MERTLPGLTLQQLGVAQVALLEGSKRLRAGGEKVRYIRSTFIPGQSRCLCLFEAENGELVKRVNDVAQFPFARIEQVLELPADKRGTA